MLGLSTQLASAQGQQELIRQMEALGSEAERCGTNMACLQGVMERMNALSKKLQATLPGSESAGSSTGAQSPGIGAAPLPRPGQGVQDSPVDVEVLKNELIACGERIPCWTRIQSAASSRAMARCDRFSLCPGLSSIDINIAFALARIEMDQATLPAAGRPIASIPKARPERAMSVLENWKRDLEASLPADALAQVDRYASRFPAGGAASPQPLAFEQSTSGEVTTITPKPTRRDWAYALQGFVFAQAGLASKDQGRLLDLALWCFIQAASMAKEAEHLANIGFFLNLAKRYAEARDVLAFARQLNSRHPDVRGNLAFSLRRLGHDAAASAELEQAATLERPVQLDDAAAGPANAVPWAPDDWGLAFFRLSRRHTLAFPPLRDAYADAQRIPLDEPLDDPESSAVRSASPRDAYSKRQAANRAATQRCSNAIPKPPDPCPFGEYIVHPSCEGLPDRKTARRLRLEYERRICQCDVRYAERAVRSHRQFVREQIDLARQFDREWAPRLLRAARQWRDEIAEINALYASTTYRFPYPEQFHGLLQSHDDEMKWFATDWVSSESERHRDLIATLQARRKKCAKAAAALEEFMTMAYKFEPLRCAPILGNTYVLNFALVNMTLFIPTSRRGSVAGKMSFDTPWKISGEYWESALGAKGVKGSVGYGPLSAEVWGRDGGDWGAGGALSLTAMGGLSQRVGKSLGKAAESGFDTLLKVDGKLESRYDSKQGLKSGFSTQVEPTVGFRTIRGRPPAWVRLRAKARPSDSWPRFPAGPLAPRLPRPDC